MSAFADRHDVATAEIGKPAQAFTLTVDADVDLVLREVWTATELLPLIQANLEHLRASEAWAHGDQTLEGLQAFTRTQLDDWLQGRAVPTMIRHRGRPAGSLNARIDTWQGNAEIGYWLTANQQGHGLIHRGTTALIDHLVHARGLERLEIRTLPTNQRSRAVAERLGFQLEGELSEAMTLDGRRHDVVLYGLTARRWRGMNTSATSQPKPPHHNEP